LKPALGGHAERFHASPNAAEAPDACPGTEGVIDSGLPNRERGIRAVSYERIWAPWRLDYILGNRDELDAPGCDLLPGAEADCFLCQCAVDWQDPRRLVVHRTDLCQTVLNRYPYNNGHLLIAPLVHRARLDQLTPEEHAAVAQELTQMVGLLESVLHPEGFNVGLNLGRVAGAGLPHPVVIDAAGGVHTQSAPGLMLGLVAGAMYTPGNEFVLTPGSGESLLLFSDGLTEAQDSQDEFYGEGRLQKDASELAGTGGPDLIETLADRALEFGLPEYRDDLTVVAITRMD
jgi:ATP adenylyltransferase